MCLCHGTKIEFKFCGRASGTILALATWTNFFESHQEGGRRSVDHTSFHDARVQISCTVQCWVQKSESLDIDRICVGTHSTHARSLPAAVPTALSKSTLRNLYNNEVRVSRSQTTDNKNNAKGYLNMSTPRSRTNRDDIMS